MTATSRLLSLPNELVSEIISYLAISCSASSSNSLSLVQSHWDAFSHYKLTAASCRDLQNLALAHTHLLEFCRSQLFRGLRVYPSMPPARVTALIDLFLRAPELVHQVKALWWTIGVEEYKATASYQWFKYASEEREVRKAKDKLELVEALTQRCGESRWGLRKVWVTGCESQRKFDDSQRKISPNGLLLSFSPFAASGLVDEESRVMRALGGLLASPTLQHVSLANIAFPSEVFRPCVGLEELRMGDDVTVVEPRTLLGGKACDTTRGIATPPRLRVLSLPSGVTSGLGVHASARSLFEREWVELGDNQEEPVVPVLDVTKLHSFSCQYPSADFSGVIRSLGTDNELKRLFLQVNDFDALVESVVHGALFGDAPLEHLCLNCNLYSTASGDVHQMSSPSNAPGQVHSQALSQSPLLSPPTLPERVSNLITFLVASSNAPARTVNIKFATSVEQGLKILSGPEALDLLLLARKMVSRFSENPSIAQGPSVNIHFLLRPGCSSGYGGRPAPGVDGDTWSGRGIQNLKAQLVERHAEAIGILSGVGVNLEVGYDLAA